MSEGLAGSQIRSIFFPRRKQHVFHRLNLEYLIPLKSMRRGSVHLLLETGLRTNLRTVGGSDEVIYSLRPQIDGMAGQLLQQGSRLVRELEQLRRQLLAGSRESFATYRAGVEAGLASRKLADALDAATHQHFFHHLLSAEHMLKDVLQVNHRDYRAHFELGWIYLNLLENLPLAEFHLEQSARYARLEDNLVFARFALRHLGDACYCQQKFGKATETALQVLHGQEQPELEHRYECARYMAVGGELASATRRLAGIVTKAPLYYMQAQVERDFTRHDAIRQMLQDLRQARVTRIRHTVHTSWQNHRLAGLILPDRIDPHALFRRTMEKHLRVMSHLPYVTLAQREQQIASLMLEDSRKLIMQEVSARSRAYEYRSERRHRRWVWVNKTGAVLLHGAAILLLSCAMFFAARYVADLAGMGNWLGGNGLVSQLLALTLASGLAGMLLVRFVPPGTRRLLRKQAELDDSLKRLELP
ncbi:MAG: hypothetical protein KDI44_00145 [Thiothrix sp.]|nr:hypothetical protein [Thiothrix sp.]